MVAFTVAAMVLAFTDRVNLVAGDAEACDLPERDLVILDGNPLTVDPMAIKDIKVVETVKEGKTVYAAN